jgi:hypothetical protein
MRFFSPVFGVRHGGEDGAARENVEIEKASAIRSTRFAIAPTAGGFYHEPGEFFATACRRSA